MVLVESQHCAYNVALAVACERDGDFISGFDLLVDEHGQRLAPAAVAVGAELAVQAGSSGVSKPRSGRFLVPALARDAT